MPQTVAERGGRLAEGRQRRGHPVTPQIPCGLRRQEESTMMWCSTLKTVGVTLREREVLIEIQFLTRKSLKLVIWIPFKFLFFSELKIWDKIVKTVLVLFCHGHWIINTAVGLRLRQCHLDAVYRYKKLERHPVLPNLKLVNVSDRLLFSEISLNYCQCSGLGTEIILQFYFPKNIIEIAKVKTCRNLL